MNILVLGLGAVGTSIAWHVQRGGTKVHVYVREKYADRVEEGTLLYLLNRRCPWRHPERFVPDSVHTSPSSTANISVDQIWICTSSTGLRGQWLSPILQTHPNAEVVSFQPGLNDLQYLRSLLPEDGPEIVQALFPFIAYNAPLEGEPDYVDGIAFWSPWRSTIPLGGKEASCSTVAGLLRRGGLRAKRDNDFSNHSAYPTAAMMPTIVALELSGWSFAELARSPWLDTAVRATRQAAEVVSKVQSSSKPLWLHAATTAPIRFLMRYAQSATPVPLETYLKFHFEKVGAQTRFFLDGWCQQGRDFALDVEAIESLRKALDERSATS